ncbi:MAG: restriction endonuclease subunit S [Veillonella sp.]|uniref:restriction endonuclease subunit S n=1 Tax=Veillonella sp. TaxID=1926307 RepID=UPI0029154694|nr:restriction endonuclease subunit S [Veillonella sp.]MDU6787366.1 restriction endonuclease subunit S [Veillonella sp.]
MGNKPRIRFKGFNDDWEQCKLGDIATFSKGNGYSKSDLAPSGEPIILYGRLYTNYETTIRNVDTFVELKDKSVISQGGEVIVPASGETAEDISRASVVKNQGIIIGGDLNVIKVNHLLNPTFLALTISNGEQQKELSKRAQGKSVVHLHNSDLQEVNLTFPLLNEQKEISSLFEKMDSVITLHQCKLEKLKLTKKALLQKLFPKNGKHIPEIRFKGFTDAWEQRKFSEITYLSGIKNKENKPYESYSISNEFGFIPQNEQFENGGTMKTADKSMYYIVTQNSFAYNPARINVGSIGYYDKPDNVIVSSLYEVFKTTEIVNDKFLWHWFKSNQFNHLIEKYQEGGVRLYFYYDKLCKGTIELPTIDEQNKISNLLESLDLYITLHQRKLERLQEVKKGLLQKMFV